MRLLYSVFILLLCSSSVMTQNEKIHSMQDWQYPYQTHYAQLSDSLQIAYVDEGQGAQTLLFIHGLGSYLKGWQKNIDSLKNHYRCIAIDLPGYGKSSKENDAYSMAFFAASVQAFIEHLELKNVVLIGHSMGGQVAVHTALKDLDVVQKLVLIAPAGFETFTEKERLWFKRIFTPALIKATPKAQIVKNFEINFYDMPADARFMVEDRLQMRQTIEYDQYCNMIPQCVQAMLKEPVFERLSDIDIPTLIVYGKDDALIPNRLLHAEMTVTEVAQNGHQQIENSQLVLLEQAGHFVQWEQAQKLNERLISFLKQE